MFKGREAEMAIALFFTIIVLSQCSPSLGKPLNSDEVVSIPAQATTNTNPAAILEAVVPNSTTPKPRGSRVLRPPGAGTVATENPGTSSDSDAGEDVIRWTATSMFGFLFLAGIYSTLKHKYCPSNFCEERDRAIVEAVKIKELEHERRSDARATPVPPYAGTSIICLKNSTNPHSGENTYTEEFYSPYSHYNIPEENDNEDGSGVGLSGDDFA